MAEPNDQNRINLRFAEKDIKLDVGGDIVAGDLAYMGPIVPDATDNESRDSLPQASPPPSVEALIKEKHEGYVAASKRYAFLYYAIRLSAGLSAGLLPFVISINEMVATGLSIVIVIATVVDMVFNPKDRWTLYSKASDLLAIAQLKARGEYEQYKGLLDVITRTESARLERLTDIEDLLEKVEGKPTANAT